MALFFGYFPHIRTIRITYIHIYIYTTQPTFISDESPINAPFLITSVPFNYVFFLFLSLFLLFFFPPWMNSIKSMSLLPRYPRVRLPARLHPPSPSSPLNTPTSDFLPQRRRSSSLLSSYKLSHRIAIAGIQARLDLNRGRHFFNSLQGLYHSRNFDTMAGELTHPTIKGTNDPSLHAHPLLWFLRPSALWWHCCGLELFAINSLSCSSS